MGEEMRELLLTGSTGFIGCALLHALKRVAPDCHIHRLCRRPIPVEAGETVIHGDLADRLPEMPDVDFVINAAGFLAPPGATLEELRPINSLGPTRLAECFAGKARKPFFFHLRTTGVSGQLPDASIADEDTPTNPFSPHEHSKDDGER